MTDLVVLYDQDLDLATLIDLDLHVALGPTAPTQQGAELLQRFATIVEPFADVLDRDSLMVAWAGWFQRQSGAGDQAAPSPDQGAVEQPRPPGVADAASAELEAADGRGAPPDPQPSDADVEANASAASQVILCWNCNGSGHVTHGDTQSVCNMCRGTGHVTIAAGTNA